MPFLSRTPQNMKSKLLKRLIIGAILLPLFLLFLVVMFLYFRQDAIVQAQISELNSTYEGKISAGDVHLAPFENFPYISLKIDEVSLHESKLDSASAILNVADIYIGFQFWDILKGNYDIQSLVVEDGFFDVVMHENGSTNIENALASSEESEASPALKVHLKSIELKNLDVHYFQEANQKEIETLIYTAKGGFSTSERSTAAHVDSEFELNIIQAGDTTYFKHKHFEFHTDFNFDHESGLLAFKPSGITMEHGEFEVEGKIETQRDMNMDLRIKGTKPSFDLFFAFAPSELIPVLERYENAGKIYFNASIEGPLTEGQQPFINASFGADEAFLENSIAHRKMDDMGFSGNFNNGEQRNFETMEFSMTGIKASLEQGHFLGNIRVKNFKAPEIEMDLDANFDIPFLVGFLNLDDIEDVQGRVEMKMSFHDIIDIDQPEKALQDLNQAYFAELRIQDLGFAASKLPSALRDLDVHLMMNGKEAQLDQFEMQFGDSDLSITGSLSDLPAIVHHSPTPVSATLDIKSKVLDIAQLTQYSEKDSVGVNERVEKLQLSFSFEALGNAFTEYTHLPKGEFFIDDLYADLKHYPHTLHDFHADVFVMDDDLNIIDFTGQIDDSDFHFNGLIYDYSAWMEEELNGDINLDITLKSDLLKFEDLFSYGGENYMPVDYRHEEIEGLELHMDSRMRYDQNQLKAINVSIDKLGGKMHVHPLRFENFSGNIDFADEHLVVEDFKGKMGRTQFDIDMNYYLGDDESIKKRDNAFSLSSNFIDFDALSNFNLKAAETAQASTNLGSTTEDVEAHAEAFNIYELPFTDMRFNAEIGHFLYHRIDLKDLKAQFRTTPEHYIYLDTLRMLAAGGEIAMNGYMNGSDPEHIYLKPKMRLEGVDLDKLLFKFENFGQDAIVSENLHGKLNAIITGNIRVYPDFVPDLDQSEVHLDAQVLDGRLDNYDPVLMLSDYFGDKDLSSIRFDTLQNHMDIQNGRITIPNMTIESTLGHMDISGTQSMNDSMEYYARIPWSLVKGAARNKIFGTKENEEGIEDEIVEVDPKKNVKYLNISITGTLEDYRIRMGKAKK